LRTPACWWGASRRSNGDRRGRLPRTRHSVAVEESAPARGGSRATRRVLLRELASREGRSGEASQWSAEDGVVDPQGVAACDGRAAGVAAAHGRDDRDGRDRHDGRGTARAAAERARRAQRHAEHGGVLPGALVSERAPRRGLVRLRALVRGRGRSRSVRWRAWHRAAHLGQHGEALGRGHREHPARAAGRGRRYRCLTPEGTGVRAAPRRRAEHGVRRSLLVGVQRARLDGPRSRRRGRHRSGAEELDGPAAISAAAHDPRVDSRDRDRSNQRMAAAQTRIAATAVSDGAVISATGLTKRYPPDVTALAGVSLAVRPGEFVAVLGPSGAGKTTLFRCLTGLTPPDDGSVSIDGREIRRRHVFRGTRGDVALIFQQFNLIRRLTAIENVLVGRLARVATWRVLVRRFARADRQLALRCLDTVGLLDRAYTRADQLSGGQQQRVAIARALAQDATVILADEPVASLDPESAATVLECLRAAVAAGVAVVASLHQVEFARAYADRIVALRAGRIVEDAPAAQIDERTLELIYSKNGGAQA